MIDVINLIERLTSKPAMKHDIDWVTALLDREHEREKEKDREQTILSCGCMMGWCDCNG